MAARLTVLGGYLGAGKTTLLNGLLAAAGEARIAVVVNDFGAVNIDRRLITSATSDTVELANGCICCSLQDDTSAVMTRLAERGDLDHVVVETSGVGDPASLRTWGTYPGFTPGPTVVCVDSTAATRLLCDEFVGDTVARQLTRADTVVLTKADLASPGQLADARRHCRTHAKDACMLQSTGGDVHLKDLLPPAAPRSRSADVRDAHRSVHRTASVTGTGLADRPALLKALRDLPDSVVRLKGLVRCADSPQARTVVQVAGGRLSVTTDGAWRDADATTLVIITAGDEAADTVLRTLTARLTEILNR
ncbi:GTP-binding protein [Streptomyces sp. LHD-70]|uniref:CobW family GTP-binding protein n=1 Tax=Streptomyces sp. LHD-70 TaxID=3072140 RepID=UPI00281067B3|nr:GTP-binding protein [Streptomyces sp. LHD-70]MDQ8708312.1 GTP-binding protein [Streptomyces sp. LHD-70]